MHGLSCDDISAHEHDFINYSSQLCILREHVGRHTWKMGFAALFINRVEQEQTFFKKELANFTDNLASEVSSA